LPQVNASSTAVQTGDFHDKEWLAVDSTTSRFRGSVYVSWTVFQSPTNAPPEGQDFIAFARSTDGGRTWLPPLALSQKDGTFLATGSMITVGPDGEVYVAWRDRHAPGPAIMIAKSIDGGATFSRPVAAIRSESLGACLNGSFDTPGFPSLAVDTSSGPNRGNVYVVVEKPPAEPGRGILDVEFTKSTDGGANWSTPIRLNDDATDTDQWHPSIAVASNGTIAAMWYDRRNDPVNNSLIDVYMTTSTDGGLTFTPNRRVTSGNWIPVPTQFGLRPAYHGDYNQMSANETHFILNWGDDRDGDQNLNKRKAPIHLSQPLPLPWLCRRR